MDEIAIQILQRHPGGGSLLYLLHRANHVFVLLLLVIVGKEKVKLPKQGFSSTRPWIHPNNSRVLPYLHLSKHNLNCRFWFGYSTHHVGQLGPIVVSSQQGAAVTCKKTHKDRSLPYLIARTFLLCHLCTKCCSASFATWLFSAFVGTASGSMSTHVFVSASPIQSLVPRPNLFQRPFEAFSF